MQAAKLFPEILLRELREMLVLTLGEKGAGEVIRKLSFDRPVDADRIVQAEWLSERLLRLFGYRVAPVIEFLLARELSTHLEVPLSRQRQSLVDFISRTRDLDWEKLS